MFVHQYELFKMLPNETITITNNLDALSRIYTNVDIVSKILRSLPEYYEVKVTTIQEAKDPIKLSLERAYWFINDS